LGGDLRIIDDSTTRNFVPPSLEASLELERAIQKDVEKYRKTGKPPDLSMVNYFESLDNIGPGYPDFDEQVEACHANTAFCVTSDKKAKKTFKFSDYQYFVRTRAAPLLASQNSDMRHLAEMLGEKNLLPPGEIYKSIVDNWTAITAFFKKHPDYKDNWTLWKVVLGLVMPYQKYRTQDFTIFDEAGEVARTNKIGLWKFDTTLNLKWEINKKIPRNNRKDCIEKRKKGG
jgi:hypothetical protein